MAIPWLDWAWGLASRALTSHVAGVVAQHTPNPWFSTWSATSSQTWHSARSLAPPDCLCASERQNPSSRACTTLPTGPACYAGLAICRICDREAFLIASDTLYSMGGKKRRCDAAVDLDAERTLYSSFVAAANSMSQLYSQAVQQQRRASAAASRQTLVRAAPAGAQCAARGACSHGLQRGG